MSTPAGVGSAQGGINAVQGFLSVVVANYGDVALQLTGTFVGTVQFEGTVDNGNWVSLALTPSGGGSDVTSATAPGAWSGNCGGYYAVRARCSAFTSGVIYVSLSAAVSTVHAQSVVVQDALSGIGTIDDPVNVQVDGTTVGINGSNQLEVLTAVPAIDATFVTATDETGTLTGSRQLVDGTNTTVDVSTPGQIKVNASGGGGGTPASPDTAVQFNNTGAFGGSADLTFDGSVLTSAKPGNFTSPGLAASLTTDLGVPNADLTWTYTGGVGQQGNATQIAYVDPGLPSQSLSASYAAPVLTINLATGADYGTVTSAPVVSGGSGWSVSDLAYIPHFGLSITGVDQGLQRFTFSDLTKASDTWLIVVGSTGKNGLYSIASGAGTNVVTVVEAIPDPTVDGAALDGSAILTVATVSGDAVTAFTVSAAGGGYASASSVVVYQADGTAGAYVNVVAVGPITTANDIIGLGSYDSAPVTVALADGSDGSGVVIALTATPLSGGLSALNVTGPSWLDNGAIRTDGSGVVIINDGLLVGPGDPYQNMFAGVNIDATGVSALDLTTADASLAFTAQGAGTINLNSPLTTSSTPVTATATFTSLDGKTVTVTNGLITSVV